MTIRHPVFISRDNQHFGNAGTADGAKSRYSSYFENMLGEQWIAEKFGTADKLSVRGGDIDWEILYEYDGFFLKDLLGNLIVLQKSERLWLQACYLAWCAK
jgi:hypothetical protein